MEHEEIFSVNSSADLAMTIYFLDTYQMAHIMLGHRGLKNQLSAVEEAVRSPTRIYKSKQLMYGASRFIFMSDSVLSGGGRPMAVIIDREGDRGKVVTASWKGSGIGELVWESTGNIYSNYDEGHDIFYLSKGLAEDEYADDDEEIPSIWLRKSEAADIPQGITILGLRDVWRENASAVVKRVSDFLDLTTSAVEMRIKAALRE